MENHELETFFSQKLCALQNQKVVIGFSGGADSTALLLLFYKFAPQYNIDLSAAHFNHQWRTSAIIDQQFCENLCKELNVPLVIGFADQHQSKNHGSQEANARAKRHQFFAQFTDSVIAMAHHQDDQLENFFIKLIRGCSLEGAAKITENTQIGKLKIFRPLLEIKKIDLINYLNQNKITHVEDPTNQDNKYLRNKIRNSLLPKLAECDDRGSKNILNFMQKINDVQDYLAQTVVELDIINNQQLNLDNWQKAAPIIQQEALKKWLFINGYSGHVSTKLITEISRFLMNSKSLSHQITPIFFIKKNKKTITVSTTNCIDN